MTDKLTADVETLGEAVFLIVTCEPRRRLLLVWDNQEGVYFEPFAFKPTWLLVPDDAQSAYLSVVSDDDALTTKLAAVKGGQATFEEEFPHVSVSVQEIIEARGLAGVLEHEPFEEPRPVDPPAIRVRIEPQRYPHTIVSYLEANAPIWRRRLRRRLRGRG